jgi:hypothetical protein
MKDGHLSSYSLTEEDSNNNNNNRHDRILPRVLMLGDSITRDIVKEMKSLNTSDIASIQGAPTNCAGFDRYRTGLDQWLGQCVWDIVQFNVGMHFKPPPSKGKNASSWQKRYRNGLVSIVQSIRAHSPSATIVLALTTPSPLDSDATMAQRETCQHYHLFHKAGLVNQMNQVAMSVAQDHDLIINDRYSAILPVLGQFQLECNIHYSPEGSRYLANHDLELFSRLLQGKV